MSFMCTTGMELPTAVLVFSADVPFSTAVVNVITDIRTAASVLIGLQWLAS